MQVKRPNILRHFRGRRIMIPLLAAVAALFLVLGGHKGIVSFAMDEMTGFLVGSDGVGRDEALARADARPAEASRIAEPARVAVAGAGPAAKPAPASPARIEVAQAEQPSVPAGAGSRAEAERMAPPPLVAPDPADSVAFRRAMKVYSATFLRDPFYSLVQDGERRPTKLLDVGVATMVGSVWGESGIIALLEDKTGRSYALKVGDRVLNGRVIAVTPASVTFSITTFGITKTVTLELAEEGE